jgi:hypothetical protein
VLREDSPHHAAAARLARRGDQGLATRPIETLKVLKTSRVCVNKGDPLRVQLREVILANDASGIGRPLLLLRGYRLNRKLWRPQL